MNKWIAILKIIIFCLIKLMKKKIEKRKNLEKKGKKEKKKKLQNLI